MTSHAREEDKDTEYMSCMLPYEELPEILKRRAYEFLQWLVKRPHVNKTPHELFYDFQKHLDSKEDHND